MKKVVKRRSQPKKLRAIQTSRHLRVSHHRHTGHILPRSHTSYPMLVMILLCVGVLLAGWTRFVTADPPSQSGQYVVKASVPGPPPPQPATITSPKPGTHTATSPITIAGGCEPGTYVLVTRNGTMSGVSICDASGHYSLQSDLFHGLNQFVAKVHNFANVSGPDSSPVNVYYSGYGNNVRAQTTSTPGSSQSGSYSAGEVPVEPLVIKSDFELQGVYTDKEGEWPLSIEGGVAPYALDVDWGDGSHDLYSRPTSNLTSLKHTYAQHGGYRGSYTIRITASDAAGDHSYLQLLAIINDPPNSTVAGGTGTTTSGSANNGISLLSSSGLGRLVKYVWPSYGVSVLMLSSFWLGERHELKFLRPHLKRHH